MKEQRQPGSKKRLANQLEKNVQLTTVGLDPNVQLFPIAYAVVEIENKETWK